MKDSLLSKHTSSFPNRIVSFALRKLGGIIPIGSRYCCYCEKKSPFFMSYKGGTKGLPPLMRVLDVIGSDVNNHLCPKCQSHDRERHLKLYFDTMGLQKNISQNSVLHFAPERWFSKYVQASQPSIYIKADLYPNSPDIQQIDMLETGFKNCEFDLVIANHVLEHVNDIGKALTELHRVLKTGGVALFQTPYSNVLHATFDDEGIVTTEARLQAFGQEDHVRLFGRDIFSFIESFGFKSRVVSHQEALAEFDATYHGVNLHEPLFLFERLEQFRPQNNSLV